MKKCILLVLIVFPVVAGAQKESFLREFNEVNDWFFRQNGIILDQKYYYFNQSDTSPAIDSALCHIVREGTSIHYIFDRVELFSDSGYTVRLNHQSRDIVVTKTPRTDSTTIKMLFNEGFSNFAGFKRILMANNLICWEMTGGVAGVSSAVITMDLMNHRITELVTTLDENHPLVNVYGKPDKTGARKIIIKIEYHYYPVVDQVDIFRLSDFIQVNDTLISAASKYKDYNIKMINQAP